MKTVMLSFLVLLARYGSNAQTFWESTGGPLGGFVSDVAVDAEGRIFTASIGPGIHRSTDGGRTWTQANSGLDNVAIECLAVNSTGSIFAGATYNNGGVFVLLTTG